MSVPSYQNSGITIINDDCLSAMQNMKSKEFDLAIVDPPYGIGNFANSTGKRRPNNKPWPIKWNDTIPSTEYFDQLYRVSRNIICWGVNYYGGNIKEVGRIFWDKYNESDIGSSGEIASQFLDRRVIKVKIANIGFIGANSKSVKIHPCQKPVVLYEWLLNKYAKPGNKILDTHGGSCSLAIACFNLGFECTIYEIDKEYYTQAVKRIEQHLSQPRKIIGKRNIQDFLLK